MSKELAEEDLHCLLLRCEVVLSLHKEVMGELRLWAIILFAVEVGEGFDSGRSFCEANFSA